MDHSDHDELVEHRVRLIALDKLPEAVEGLRVEIGKLRIQLAISNARILTVASCVGCFGGIVGTVGTWIVMIHTGK